MSGPYHPADDLDLERLQRAAFSGEPQAQFEWAEILRRGLLGITQDEAQAKQWYKKAAETGHPTAVFLLNNWRKRDHFK